MATVKQRDLPPSPEGRKLVKLLAELTYSRRPDDVYSDFLHITEIYLRRLPINVLHGVQHGTMPKDDGEDTEAWQRIAKKYTPKEFKIFAEASAMLMDMCDPTGHTDYEDILGEIYMFWGWPNSAMGQYFTPYPIAKLMASMTMLDIDQMCRKAVADAIDASIYHEVWGASGASMTMPGKEDLMLYMLPLVYKHLKPIAINEPCVGSGVMMLAAAACCPRWAIDTAVVQFWGSDIDPDCVLMSRINFMLYGLNGYFALLTAAAHGIGPDSTAADLRIDLRDTLRNPLTVPATVPATEQDTEPLWPLLDLPLPKDVPHPPAPVVEPLPIAASPAARPKPKATTKTITLPPHNSLAQLSMLDMLNNLERKPPKGKGKKRPPSTPLMPTPPAM